MPTQLGWQNFDITINGTLTMMITTGDTNNEILQEIDSQSTTKESINFFNT
jgi:uncharacterized protein YabE (DUF348 family)